MSTTFSDALDDTLARFKAAGYEALCVVAGPDAIERIFVERGDAAILLDCDEKRDVAWYQGEFELRARAEPGAVVTCELDGQTLEIAVGDLPPPNPDRSAPETPESSAERAAA
ncbi:MAG TPA: hypothetical protein VFW47_08755 [Phenylobacterium sp.]|nr:hypothetical protein [Phenylobacterium sp.]